jgi:hypothetical protein
MSKQAAEHHRKAAEHHEHAALVAIVVRFLINRNND